MRDKIRLLVSLTIPFDRVLKQCLVSLRLLLSQDAEPGTLAALATALRDRRGLMELEIADLYARAFTESEVDELLEHSELIGKFRDLVVCDELSDIVHRWAGGALIRTRVKLAPYVH